MFSGQYPASNKKKQMLFEEAEAWLFGDESNGVFSFVSVCALLGFDPGYIRRGLRQWQERAVGAKAKETAWFWGSTPTSRGVKVKLRGFTDSAEMVCYFRPAVMVLGGLAFLAACEKKAAPSFRTAARAGDCYHGGYPRRSQLY